MERFKINVKKIIDWFTDNRNMLFLGVCLVIHGIYVYIFYMLRIQSLAILNIFSSSFYFYYLFIKKDTSEKSMAAAYFEILLFSVLSELALGPDYGFFLYIVGMAAAVFYLVPSYGNKRFLYEIIGIVMALLTEGFVMISGISFPGIQNIMAPYQVSFYLVNLGITATIVLAATFFYSQETERVWESLEYNMNHDVLTGLYNRRFFERQMELTPYYERSQYVISMVDIDYFKKVNDTYGHEAGDRVLAGVATSLKDMVGEKNLAVRWGGEEFILYFPKMTPDKVYPIMESLRRQIEDMVIESAGKKIHVTITIGIATGMPDSNYEKIIKSADEKLYLGKQRGRNQIII